MATSSIGGSQGLGLVLVREGQVVSTSPPCLSIRRRSEPSSTLKPSPATFGSSRVIEKQPSEHRKAHAMGGSAKFQIIVACFS